MGGGKEPLAEDTTWTSRVSANGDFLQGFNFCVQLFLHVIRADFSFSFRTVVIGGAGYT